VKELKSRIGNHNFSYGNNALTTQEHLANYNSNTSVVHKPLGSANIDKQMITDQRIKLTKSNFMVGTSPLAFGTSASETHGYLAFKPNNPAERNALRDKNSKTNFISKGNGGLED